MAQILPRMVAALVSIPATGTVDLGTQLPVALDGSAPFSIGLWVQLEDPQATETLASTSAFTLGVAAGVPYATLVGQSAIPTSAPTPVPADPTIWSSRSTIPVRTV